MAQAGVMDRVGGTAPAARVGKAVPVVTVVRVGPVAPVVPVVPVARAAPEASHRGTARPTALTAVAAAGVAAATTAGMHPAAGAQQASQIAGSATGRGDRDVMDRPLEAVRLTGALAPNRAGLAGRGADPASAGRGTRVRSSAARTGHGTMTRRSQTRSSPSTWIASRATN